MKNIMDGKKKPNFYIIFPSIKYCLFFYFAKTQLARMTIKKYNNEN